jgi:hypothetical protein
MGTDFPVDFGRPSSRIRTSVSVAGLIAKSLAMILAETRGYLARTFDKTSSKIAAISRTSVDLDKMERVL